MIRKTINSLFWIYLFQIVLLSCEVDDCNCPPAVNFEITYNGLDLDALDTSNSQMSVVDGTVSKNSFALALLLLFEREQIALNFKHSVLSGFSFYSANACTCIPDSFTAVDPIVSISINVTDVQNQEMNDVTDDFTTTDFDGEQVTINEYFDNGGDWYQGLQIFLTDNENIPDSSIFTVEIVLDSGTAFIQETQEIAFE